jgi:hypothetical protein
MKALRFERSVARFAAANLASRLSPGGGAQGARATEARTQVGVHAPTVVLPGLPQRGPRGRPATRRPLPRKPSPLMATKM